MKTIIATLALIAPTAALAEVLDLECRGNAVVTEDNQRYEKVPTADGGSQYGFVSHPQTTNVTAVVRVRIDEEGKGRIKLPGPLQTNGRGDDGWWDFSSLEITDDAIRGKFSMSMFAKPRVTIDRRTGDIDYQGGGTRFAGMCERASDVTERKF